MWGYDYPVMQHFLVALIVSLKKHWIFSSHFNLMGEISKHEEAIWFFILAQQGI